MHPHTLRRNPPISPTRHITDALRAASGSSREPPPTNHLFTSHTSSHLSSLVPRSSSLITLLLLTLTTPLQADRTVDINGSAAYTSIQAAIDDASPGETITVLPGRYVENINFLGKDLVVTSTDPNDPAVVAVTIIDGSLPSDPFKASVVTLENGETSAAVLTGFTITGGTGTVPDFDPFAAWAPLYDDIFRGYAPEGIALHAEAAKVYWTDQIAKKVQRANLDGSNLEDMVTSPDAPFALALDIGGGKMYWTEDGFPNYKIRRANLDGTALEDLVTGLHVLGPVTLHPAAGKMYWNNQTIGSIYRANLDGTNQEEILSVPYYSGRLTLDAWNAKMYWTEWSPTGYKIKRANLDGTDAEDLVALGSRNDLRSLILDIPQAKMYWVVEHRGGGWEIQRSDLDGQNFQYLIYSSRPINGMTLDRSAAKLYWTQFPYADTAGRIRRANTDGTDAEILIATLYHPTRIVLDVGRRKMYWTDPAIRKIQRANFDGSQIEDLVRGRPALGAGIYCDNAASPTITRNIIRNNMAGWGAGIAAIRDALPTITHNHVDNNTALGWGAAMYTEYPYDPDEPPVFAPVVTDNLITRNTGASATAILGSSPTFARNTVINNNAIGFAAANTILVGITLSPHIPVFPTIEDNTFAGNGGSTYLGGGAINCANMADATIARNTIVFNATPSDGGGIATQSVLPPSLLHVADNAILYNAAHGYGGGSYSYRGGSFLTGNTFAHNTADRGGAVFGDRRGIASAINYPGQTLVNNFIIENTARQGGGLYLAGTSPPFFPQGHILTRNFILRNVATTGGAIFAGGPPAPSHPNPAGIHVLIANVVAQNRAIQGSGGILADRFGRYAILAGNTIVDNTSDDPAAINGLDYDCDLSIADGDELANNILYDNTNDITPGCEEPLYNDIGDATYGGTNLSVDPGFVDPANGDYHLRADSPLIDAGHPAYLVHTIDPSGSGDLPPVWPTFLETDLDGDDRIINGGLDNRVDIGADEFDPAAARPSPDPMDFAAAFVVADGGQLKISLAAKTATVPADPTAGVEYLFESPTGARKGPSSGWQASATFLAAGLELGNWYTYRVKARNADRPDQETHWSPIRAFFLTAPGDLDRDGDVDVTDFLTFASCYNGPLNPPRSECLTPFADTNDDTDVDGNDFLTFANCFNGSLNTPSCL